MSRFVEWQPCGLVTEKYTDRRLRLKCDCTWAETKFRLSAKRTSPFKSVGKGGWGVSVQSTTSRRAVHISLQGLYCSCEPVFCSHVTLAGYPFHLLVSPSLLLPCVTACHHISNAVYHWTQIYSLCLHLFTCGSDASFLRPLHAGVLIFSVYTAPK
jgi:hypothetical protein